MKSSKVKYLEVSAQIVADICKRAIKGRLPQDAEVLRVNYNVLTNNFDVVVYSEEFPELKEGSQIPRLEDPVVSEDVLK
jgi:hypothetical protein